MFKWLSNLFGVLASKPHVWQCDTHGSWVRIFENNEIVYAGNIANMPPSIKRRYNDHMAAIQKVEAEIENIHKQLKEFEQHVRKDYRRTRR